MASGIGAAAACLPGAATSLGLRSGFSRNLSPGPWLRTSSFRNKWYRGGARAMTSESESNPRKNSDAGDTKAPQKSYAWPDRKNPRICILGGGFGGLYTALRLESLVWTPENRPQILLIDQSERFVFKPMLYELLSKEVDVWEIAPLFAELLASTSIRFLRDSVKSVSPFDAAAGDEPSSNKSSSPTSIGGRVYLDSGTLVDYDWLVLALGAETRTDIVPGASEFALPFATLEDALAVDAKLESLERGRFGDPSPIEIAVVGSGYCGIELAATVAERLGERGRVQVIDVTSEICPSATAGNREKASEVLSSRNVKLELGQYVTKISPAEQNRVTLELKPATRSPSRRSPPSSYVELDLVLWTVGNRALVPGPGSFPVNGRGQADTEETLRVRGHPRIFAIGDSAGTKDSSGRLLPTTAQVALQQADYAGWNLWAAIHNKPLLPFRYQHLGEMMTLGRYNAAVSPGFLEDITLDGVLAHTARKLAYLYRLPTNEHRVKVGLSWFTKSAVDTLAFVQNSFSNISSSRSS